MFIHSSQRFVLTLLIVGTTACASHHCKMHSLPGAPGGSFGLSVSGVGEAKAAPDIARASIGVEVRAETAEQASQLANAQMAAVIAALKALGIANKDLRTHGFSIDFEREPTPPYPPPEPPSTTRGKPAAPAPASAVPRGFYRVQNMVEATIRELGKVGAILGAATSAGANNIWGVAFELEDPRALASQARANAFENAKHDAAEMARLAGVKLGPIVSVSEDAAQGGPGPSMMSMRMKSAETNDVPIEQGQLTMRHTAQIVYALHEP